MSSMEKADDANNFNLGKAGWSAEVEIFLCKFSFGTFFKSYFAGGSLFVSQLSFILSVFLWSKQTL